MTVVLVSKSGDQGECRHFTACILSTLFPLIALPLWRRIRADGSLRELYRAVHKASLVKEVPLPKVD